MNSRLPSRSSLSRLFSRGAICSAAHRPARARPAFSVPIIQRLDEDAGRRCIRALILTPTRELALQIYENVCQYARAICR